jgi:manganese oxidase
MRPEHAEVGIMRSVVRTRAVTLRRAGLAIAAAGALGLLAAGFTSSLLSRAAGVTGSVCPTGARAITYDVAAFQTVIPLNGWGDHIPDGLVYGLKGADARVGKADILANANLTQPFVVRANVGDCITVTLRNDIAGRRVGIHVDGLVQADPKDSDGTRVGFNPDSTAGPQGALDSQVSYTWYADKVGQSALVDAANLDGAASDHTSIQRGLYGALIVHPKDTTWHNPVTGEDLLNQATGVAVETQVFADVRGPNAGDDYRSFALVILDENEGVKDRDGRQPTFPTTGLPDSTFGINYRSEPLRNRIRAVLEHRAGKTVTLPNGRIIAPEDHFCDGWAPDLNNGAGGVAPDPGAKCIGEESHLQSWPYGDEGKLTRVLADGTVVTDTDNQIPKAYKGDPVRYHVIHPGSKETHPFHQHTHRWFSDPNNDKSPLNDVQSIGPGESREFRLEGGGGGLQGTIGDSIFHCHLYPHFAQGFWSHFRIFDRLRDGTQKYPDGTPLQKLVELPDRVGQTPAPDEAHPGFPLFLKGDFMQRAYRPPHAVVNDTFAALRRPGDAPRGPTTLEAANLPALDKAKPGAGYIDPCPTTAPMRTYRPHAIDLPLTYNKAGWKDPEARIYVEESHKADVISGKEQPEPYTIRSVVGECVQLLTTNDTHLDDDPAVPIDTLNKKDGAYQHPIQTSEISTHVHLVQFDELGTDGTSVGWNYVQAAMPGQTYGYRWFVDVPLRTVFFHDHQYANSHQQKGLFAAMNVEPPKSTFHNPKTGAPTDGVGTVADIRTPEGPDFRELSVFYSDRVPMWKANGQAFNPPPAVDDFGADQGGYALNYRNEPFQIRATPGATGLRADPAYIYSSAVHGDPSTPVFRAYAGDPVIVRNMIGAHEEMHTFNLHGHKWLSEPDSPKSNIIDTQSGSLGEFFNYELRGGRVVRGNLSLAALLSRARLDPQNGVPGILRGGAGGAGDYLYGSTPLDDQWLGMWGIFRVPSARVSDLAPLPDRPAPRTGQQWPALRPGDAMRGPLIAGLPCPIGAPVRTYAVSAVLGRITYNEKTGDHDPLGVRYVLAGQEGQPPEPLYLRANAGDCVRVTLTNKLPSGGIPAHTGDVPLPGDAPFPKSSRVSMHPALVSYDVTRSDGATVGYNFDTTVAPGGSRNYVWYVDPDLAGATALLADFGDRRGHRHHGLWGGLLIEPKGSTWTHPVTGLPITTGAQAVIRWTNADGTPGVRREFVTGIQDGLRLLDDAGAPIAPAGPVEDAYELGNRGVNYRTERFAPRLVTNPRPAWVMSSAVHGDPATPVFRSFVGDPTWFRLLMGQDRGRAHTFTLHGHRWANQLNDPGSMLRSSQDGVMPGRSFTYDLDAGAGGTQKRNGDYLFRDGLLINQVNAGLWGLLRVHDPADPAAAGLKPLG